MRNVIFFVPLYLPMPLMMMTALPVFTLRLYVAVKSTPALSFFDPHFTVSFGVSFFPV